jgi:hypothetical protein
MKQKKLKKLGYGVAIHFNEYTGIFEVYQIGTYNPSDPNINKESQIVTKNKSLKKAVKSFQNYRKLS